MLSSSNGHNGWKALGPTMQSCRQNKKGSRDKKTLSLEYLNLQAEACMPVTHASSWRGPPAPTAKAVHLLGRPVCTVYA